MSTTLDSQSPTCDIDRSVDARVIQSVCQLAIGEMEQSVHLYAEETPGSQSMRRIKEQLSILREECSTVETLDDARRAFDNCTNQLEGELENPYIFRILHELKMLTTHLANTVPTLLESHDDTDGYWALTKRCMEANQLEMEAEATSEIQENSRGLLGKLFKNSIVPAAVGGCIMAVRFGWSWLLGQPEAGNGNEISTANTAMTLLGMLYAIFVGTSFVQQFSKIKDANRDLDLVVADLLYIAREFPEGHPRIATVIEDLDRAINVDGKIPNELVDTIREVISDRSETEKGQVRDAFLKLENDINAFVANTRPEVSRTNRLLFSWYGSLINLAATLTGSNVTEALVASISAIITTSSAKAMNDSLHTTIGQEAAFMKVSDKPVKNAKNNLGAQRQKRVIETDMLAKLSETAQLESRIASSFLTDFLQRFEARKAGKKQPEFLVGQAVVNQGVLEAHQLAFRHDDDHLMQLAILESVREQLREHISEPSKYDEAKRLINTWIRKVRSARAEGEVTHKDDETTIAHATKAIVTEITGNLEGGLDPAYVFTHKIDRQQRDTASRQTDWQSSDHGLLDTIHERVVSRLKQKATEDEGNASKYEKVVTDIQRVREEQGRPKVASNLTTKVS